MSDRMDEIRSTRAPRLRTDQIEILKRYGEIRKTEVGEVLFRAGDTRNDFIVVLEGEVKVGDDFAGEARTIGVFHESRFLGELNMLTGQAMYLTGVVSEAGEVLAIPRERLKEVVTEEPNISDVILKAFLARRSYMMRTGLGLRIIGSRHSAAAARLREFAARNRVPHVWIELEDDPEAEALLERFGARPSETPVTEGDEVISRSVIAATGARYRRLEVAGLGRFEGVSVHYAATEAEARRCKGEEVAVVGGGHSAGQAALFLAGRTRRVYLLIRGGDLGKGMSRYLVDRVTSTENVELLANTEVRELVGEDRLEGVVVEDTRSGARRTLGAKALFVFIGAEANTGWLEGAV